MKLGKSGMILAAAVTGMAVMAMSVSAQSRSMRVHIPFAFHVGDATLPAGNYTMQMQGPVFRITDGRGHFASVLSNGSANRNVAANTRVVFKASGNAWILTQIRWQDYRDARDIIQPASSELEAANAAPQRTVSIVAR